MNTWCGTFATQGVLLDIQTLEDGRYVVIKANKQCTASEIWRDFFCISIYCVSVVSLHIESTDSMTPIPLSITFRKAFNTIWYESFLHWKGSLWLVLAPHSQLALSFNCFTETGWTPHPPSPTHQGMQGVHPLLYCSFLDGLLVILTYSSGHDTK